MLPTARPTACRPGRPTTRRGFSFAEVMFAVVILGIGFIMVAAIFPVALQQTQATSEENSAGAAARGAAAAIAAAAAGGVPNPVGIRPDVVFGMNSGAGVPATQVQRTVPMLPLFPPTVKNHGLGQCDPGVYPIGTTTPQFRAVPPAAVVVPFTGERWDAVRANAVVPADPRFAYVAFYKREGNSNLAQVIVVSVASRGGPTFDPAQLDGGVTGTASTAQGSIPASYAHARPTPANPYPAGIYPNPAAPASPAFPSATEVDPDVIMVGATPAAPATTFEGGYVTVESYAAVNGAVANAVPIAAANQTLTPFARTYQLGRLLSGTTYELLPGGDLTLSPGVADRYGTAAWGRTHEPVDPALPTAGVGIVRDAGQSGIPVVRYANGPLQPSVGYVTLGRAANSPAGQMAVYDNPTDGTPCGAAVAGAFVILADDFPCDPATPSTARFVLPFDFDRGATVTAAGVSPTGSAQSFHVGSLNGRIFRLGTLSSDHLVTDPATGNVSRVAGATPSTFDLDPSYGMRPVPADPYQPQYSPDTIPSPSLTYSPVYPLTTPPPTPAPVYGSRYAGLRARAYILPPPADPTTGVRGTTAQDVGCYSVLVPVR